MKRRMGRITGTVYPVVLGTNGSASGNGNGNMKERQLLVEGPRDMKTIPGKGKLPEREVDVTPDLPAFKMSNRIGRLISGGHVELHEYIAKIMGCFDRFERFSIYVDRSKFRSLFESQWMRSGSKNGASQSRLTHYLTVDRNKDGTFSPRAIDSYVLEGRRKSITVFRQCKPTLIHYGPNEMLVFNNMDPDSDRCTYDYVEQSGRTGMKAFFPIPYGEPARAIGLNIMEGDLTLRGSQVEGLSRLYLSAIPFASASALIAEQLMHRFDWTTQLSRKEDFEYHFRNLVSNLLKRRVRNGYLLLVDIDKFKEINTRYGLYIGDMLLGRIANAIKSRVKKADIISRWGGDEFGVLLTDEASESEVNDEEVTKIAIRLKQEVSAAYVKLPNEGSSNEKGSGSYDSISRNCSIGVVNLRDLMDVLKFDGLEDCCVQIFQHCNNMLDRAKREGRNGVYHMRVQEGKIVEVSY